MAAAGEPAAGPAINSGDKGLERNAVGLPSVLSQSLANVGPTIGILFITGLVVSKAGAAAPFDFILVTVGLGFGEYSRIELTTPVADLADRASSYAMPGEVVDGQDADAVRAAVQAAVSRARAGGGPALIEAKTYRYSGHSRSDQGTYRPAGELDQWLQRDPITLLADRLTRERVLTSAAIESIWTRQRELLADTVEQVLAAPRPGQGEMFGRILAAGG